MDELKKELKKIALASETYQKITVIGDKYNLLLDLQEELAAEIQDVIMGFKPAKNFVKNIQDRLEIDSEKANEIAIDVNLEILGPIQDKLQKIQEEFESKIESVDVIPPQNLPVAQPPAPSFVGLEKAGQFTIEKTPSSSSSQYNEENINKEALLKSIEDKPAPAAAPMIDHLLTAHVNTSEKVEVKETAPIEQKAVGEKKPYTADPYREQF